MAVDTASSGSPRLVVGIGASAGGLEAYTRLLKALPPETGLAFLLVPHLSPTHHSQLAELLARSVPFPVTEARDGDEMRADHLYVLPPDKVMRITDGHVRLDPRSVREGPPTVIDDCLTSLAEACGPKAVGVVLSGTGSDGAAGLQAIKAHGGVTYVQDFASAMYDGMPRNAVEAGGVDHTLPPEAIARSLTGLVDPEVLRSPGEGSPEAAMKPSVEPAGESEPVLSDPDAVALEKILELLRNATGVDFQLYKRPTLARRVSHRMAELGLADLSAYLVSLQDNLTEAEALFNSVLIHHTEFFREPAMYEVLRATVIPALLAHRPVATPIRAWVVGCSTGEEAYSTAIVVSEVAAELKREVPFKIFASDLSESAIATARLGRYGADIAERVSPERLARFFMPVDGGFQVGKRLRETCVFARQDVTRDPPFAQLDLVICRNLLIYLEPVLQRRVLQVLHYALKPGSFLALGAAESAGGSELFSPLDRKHKVYLRRTAPSHLELSLGWSGQERSVGGSLVRPSGPTPAPWTSAELQGAAAQALFTQYPRGSVIVNADLEIRHFQGAVSPYLDPPSGGPTTQLLRMAHPDLRLILGRLIRKAQKEHREVQRRDVRIRVGPRTQRVKVTVLPVPTDETERDHYLVVFDSAPSPRGSEAVAPGADGLDTEQESAAAGTRALELEQELADTKEYLQAVIDQQDETHAELQAAYEASLSANEEFQSTNEELESIKEELQSVNEELTTINEQMQQTNAELTARTAQVTGLLEAMDFAILLLGPDLRLHAFNTTAASQLRLARTAIGRPITEVQAPLPLEEFRDLVDRALAEKSLQEREVQDRDGRWYALRVWPVMPGAGAATAVVAAMVDIGVLKHDLEYAQKARLFSEAILQTAHEALVVLDGDLRIVTANRAFDAVMSTFQGALAGTHLWELGTGEWDIPELRSQVAEVARTGQMLENYELTIESVHGGRRTFRLNARRIQHGATPSAVLLALEDVTERRVLERQMIEAGRMQAVGQLAGGVAHEINNQMTTVLGFGQFLARSAGLTEQERADVAQILKGATRAADITRQLLAFGRRQPSAPSAIELNSLVVTAEGLLQKVLGSDITLEIRLGNGVGAVRVDQAQFEQVLVNLALNARDAMGGGGRLRIETTSVVVTESAAGPTPDARVPSGRYARLIVQDSGTGMPEATRLRIFEPFFTTKAQGLGTGLGLASVYGTVKQSGGFIWVESEEGRGTTFTIDVPQVAATTKAKPPSAPTVAPTGSETIVVAEDDAVVRQWLARSLRELGYTALEAADGAEALRLMESNGNVDLVVADLVMPGIGGAELQRRLAQTRPGFPVLLMSAYAFDELLGRGLVDRGDLVLQKPFDVAEVATRIRALLDALSRSPRE